MRRPGGRRSGCASDVERKGVWSAAGRQPTGLEGEGDAGDRDTEHGEGIEASASRELTRSRFVRAGAGSAGRMLGESEGPGVATLGSAPGARWVRRARGLAWLALWVCLAAAALPGGEGACTEWETEVDLKHCTNGVVAATYDTNDEEPPTPPSERFRAFLAPNPKPQPQHPHPNPGP